MSARTRKLKAAVSEAPEVEAVSVLRFDRTSAIASFRDASANWQTSSLRMVATATVVFFVGTAEQRAPTEILEDLETAVRERGVARAQLYRYLGLARMLFAEVAKSHPQDATGTAVLGAETPEMAAEVILAYCSKRKIASLDKLGQHLGAYARSAKAKKREHNETPTAGEAPTPAHIAKVLGQLVPEAIAFAMQTAEIDPIEMVEAIAARASVEAIQRMIAKLQARLDTIVRDASSPWRDAPVAARAEREAPTAH